MNMPIKIFPSNPKANYIAHKEEIDAAISGALDSGRYILGQEVTAFENEFADYIGVRSAVGVASGTEALHIALRACGIGVGDEVITVSHTAVATVAAIELCGATPVLVDIDLSTYTMNPGQIEQAITESTKAIIPVHLYGCPVDMESVMSIARRYKLRMVEDCAQSHGAVYKGRRTGAWGDAAAFSFYPTKNLGAIGDGGMIVSNSTELAERVKELREYGWRERYVSHLPGVNSRLDELQAAILRVKLRYLDEENRKRRALANIYDDALSGTALTLPVCTSESNHVYHQYVVGCERRDSLKEFLRSKGIGTLIHYPVPVHLQPAYRERLRCVGPMENTESVAKRILSLPVYPELTPEEVKHVAEVIVSWERSTGE